VKKIFALLLLSSIVISIEAAGPSLRSRRQHKAQGGASAEPWVGARNDDRSPRSGRQRVFEMINGCRSLRELECDRGAFPRANALGFTLPPAPQAEGNAHNQALQTDAQTQAALAAYQQAQSLFQQNRLEQSLAALEEALKLNPKLVLALTLKARLAMAANRLDVAKTCLLKAVEIEPQSAYAQFLLGFFYYLDNDFKNALPPLDRARQLMPDDARTQFYLALTYEALGRNDDAIANYEQAIRLGATEKAQLADTLTAYARLLFTLGRYGESEKLIDRALAVAPDSRDGNYEKGRLLFEKRDYAGAIACGERALALQGVGVTERQIHFLLARAYTKTGRKELAEFHLAKFRASNPSLRR